MNNQLSSHRSQSIEIPTIVEDVRRALSAGAYISALALALTIPDICGKVLYPKEESGSRYRKWYCEFIGRYECPQTDVEDPNTEKMPYPSADVVYSLRCSLLHDGKVSINNNRIKQEENRVDEFELIIDDPCRGGYSSVEYKLDSCSIKRRKLALNLVNLCVKLCRTALAFYEDHLGCCSANAPRITIKDYLGESSIREIGDFLL